MALSDRYGARGVRDCKIIPIVSDTEAGVSYGGMIDIPGIRAISITPNWVEDTLEGDDEVLDIYRKLRSIGWTLEFAKGSFDALAVLLGGEVSETGGTRSHLVTNVDLPRYFKLIGRIAYSPDYPDGDHHVILYKCKGGMEPRYSQAYAAFTASGEAIKQDYNGRIMETLANAAATEIEVAPSVDAASAFNQTAQDAGTEQDVILAVKAVDGEGDGVPMVPVVWEITSTDGQAGELWKDRTFTDHDGLSYTYYKTGASAGANTVNAIVASESPITFTITTT